MIDYHMYLSKAGVRSASRLTLAIAATLAISACGCGKEATKKQQESIENRVKRMLPGRWAINSHVGNDKPEDLRGEIDVCVFHSDGIWISETKIAEGGLGNVFISLLPTQMKGTWRVDNGRFSMVVDEASNIVESMILEGREHPKRSGRVHSIDGRRFVVGDNRIFHRLK